MRKFNGDYYELVDTIARGTKNNKLTVEEAFVKFVDLVNIWSILKPLENADKTVEDLFKDVKNKNKKFHKICWQNIIGMLYYI